MSAVIKPAQTMRGDFTYKNSAEAIKRFPFPYPEDTYMYSVNMEMHDDGEPGSVVEHAFDIDEHYLTEMKERALVLEKDPNRYAALPHMDLHEWDVLELIMTANARNYPEHFSLKKDGDNWEWENQPMGIKQSFVFGDKTTLPYAPLEYINRQNQGDLVVLDQREDMLFADAVCGTTVADWSINFDVGMSFNEWHGPVPVANELGVFDRALKYLLMLRLGQPARRLNWTLTINPRADTSPETYHLWGSDRSSITTENVGEKVHLRVELQTLFRLPRSNGMLFCVRAYLASMEDLCTNPIWAKRLHSVMKNLHPELSDYKGITPYRKELVAWLSKHA
jgi:dimethylamine monooxygenase subunit A